MNREQGIEQQIKELEEARQRKTLVCPHCERRLGIQKFTIIREHHYVQPYSCTGGDYWTFSNEYYLWCPKCETFSRAYNESWTREGTPPTANQKLYDFIYKYERYFGERLDDYDYTYETIDELRKINKEREERARGVGDW